MFQTISMKQLEKILDSGRGYLLVDVRDEEDYRNGHLEGAINLPYEEIFRAPEVLPFDRTIIVYCARGSSSMLAARELEQMGYEVINTYGGLSYYRGRHYTAFRESI